MEECILCFVLAGEELNIINDQYVYHLIEVHKIIGVVILDGINELYSEFFGSNVQYGLAREFFFNFNSNGLGQVSFSKSDTTIYKEWVESGSARFFCDSSSGRTCQSVAIAFDEVLKGVVRVELRLYVDLF